MLLTARRLPSGWCAAAVGADAMTVVGSDAPSNRSHSVSPDGNVLSLVFDRLSSIATVTVTATVDATNQAVSLGISVALLSASVTCVLGVVFPLILGAAWDANTVVLKNTHLGFVASPSYQ